MLDENVEAALFLFSENGVVLSFFKGVNLLIKQWNFIFENKLITVYGKDVKQAKEEAMKIFEQMQKAV